MVSCALVDWVLIAQRDGDGTATEVSVASFPLAASTAAEATIATAEFAAPAGDRDAWAPPRRRATKRRRSTYACEYVLLPA